MTQTDTVTITLPSAKCRGVDLLLRGLEMTRQAWSMRWKGAPGMFAGYDSLDIGAGDLSDDGWVTFSACEVRGGPRSQVVELRATYRIADTDAAASAVIVEGRGRNLTAEAKAPTRLAPPSRSVHSG